MLARGPLADPDAADSVGLPSQADISGLPARRSSENGPVDEQVKQADALLEITPAPIAAGVGPMWLMWHNRCALSSAKVNGP